MFFTKIEHISYYFKNFRALSIFNTLISPAIQNKTCILFLNHESLTRNFHRRESVRGNLLNPELCSLKSYKWSIYYKWLTFVDSFPNGIKVCLALCESFLFVFAKVQMKWKPPEVFFWIYLHKRDRHWGIWTRINKNSNT